MSNNLIQWLELNQYIDDNIEVLSVEEKEKLIHELEILTQIIINN